jgi:hypothetical protein
MSSRSFLRSRRGLLLGGLAATTGAAVAAAPEAGAATARAVLVGRDNPGGTGTTTLTATTGRLVWRVVQRGAGVGAAVYAQATALLGVTALSSGWGLHGRADATRTGTGGAVRAQGRRNAGVLADTTAQDVPALVAIGGDGTGVAQVATGQSYLDGDALALRSWTGVLAADGVHVAYAPVLSGEAALHAAAGNAALDGSGGTVVPLPSTFTRACDTTTLAVTVTPVGAAMPGLVVTYRQQEGAAAGVRDAFTVSGGVAGGTVAWSAWATRRAVDLQQAQSTALGQGEVAAPDGAPTPGSEEPGGNAAWGRRAVPARLERREVRLPRR